MILAFTDSEKQIADAIDRNIALHYIIHSNSKKDRNAVFEYNKSNDVISVSLYQEKLFTFPAELFPTIKNRNIKSLTLTDICGKNVWSVPYLTELLQEGQNGKANQRVDAGRT